MEESSFSKLATELQRTLGALTPPMGEMRPRRGFNAYLLRRLQRLKLKMYQEPGHALPHLHVDYGKENHTASYAIDPPRLLVGGLRPREETVVLTWIGAHKDQLLAAWRSFQDGNPNSALLAELRGKA
jgi:hypothetical protein